MNSPEIGKKYFVCSGSWLEGRTEGDELWGHRAWGIALHNPVDQEQLRASLWLPWRLRAVSVCPGVWCPRLGYSSGSPFMKAARLLLKRFPESKEDCTHLWEVPSRTALRYFWQSDVTAAFWIPLHIPFFSHTQPLLHIMVPSPASLTSPETPSSLCI